MYYVVFIIEMWNVHGLTEEQLLAEVSDRDDIK